MSDQKNPIIVALDGMDRVTALALATQLAGKVWGFKVNDLLIDCGVEIIRALKPLGNVFADPKLHDIPSTVSNSVAKLSAAGADFVTLHASGGEKMLREAEKARGNSKLLAVTVLTSHTDQDTRAIYHKPVAEAVSTFADLAADCGLDGIVCSGEELSLLTQNSKVTPLLKVVPGIRPSSHTTRDDQSRTLTPREAIAAGANYLVIGRPITKSENPLQAVARIISEL